jgi:dihydroorotate dehydrogenase electron transfer subunit
MTVSDKNHRDTIFLEQAEILSHEAFAEGQHLLRLQAPECARHAKPGNFVHLQCDPLRPLRRPISLMRVSATEGWVELLYKVVGEGTALLAGRKPGEGISLLGPIGTPFRLHRDRPRPLLIGGGIGMPPMLFLAETVCDSSTYAPFAILGSELPFPFATCHSAIPVTGMPPEATATLALLENWGIPARLTSLGGFDGCFNGFVTDLARQWLDAITETQRREVEIFACGPHPMLEAVATLARDYDLPCQVSLEEFMACGVGGCAGCVVEVTDDSGSSMKRVCVDGPVFEAAQIFPA